MDSTKIKEPTLGIIPFVIVYIGLFLIYETPLQSTRLTIFLFFLIFALIIIGITIYAFAHKVPVWTLPWLGFAALIPFVLFYMIGLYAQTSLLLSLGLVTLIISIHIILYILRKHSRNWLLFSLPFFVFWGFFMCDEMHPLVITFVQTLISLFCIAAVFLLIYTKFRWHRPILITSMVLYTGIYIYLTFYAPFNPGSSLILTNRNNYCGVMPTLIGYFIPGIIIILGPIIAYLQPRFTRKSP